MRAFTQHTGSIALMDRSNVDTDQIIPKQFLKRIERTGFGEFLFYDWRFDDQGQPNPEFELNQPHNASATILVARYNFGCGSSREHAVWAIEDYGFRAVIAESFADIFYNNCFKNGVLPVALKAEAVELLFTQAGSNPEFQLQIDLESQTVTGDGIQANFEIDDFRKHRMLNGLDDIAMTLQKEDAIWQFEQARGYQPVR